MKALILAKSGFGKSTSIGEIPELGIKGLDPKETYLISCVNKPLPFRGAAGKYKITTSAKIAEGNRIITNDAKEVASIIEMLANSPFKNIVLDDMNYISQDFYMKNALKGGWDTPKQIGYGMGLIFNAIKKIPETKNIICCAHYEEFKDKYQVWDFGKNHEPKEIKIGSSERLGSSEKIVFPYDEFVSCSKSEYKVDKITFDTKKSLYKY